MWGAPAHDVAIGWPGPGRRGESRGRLSYPTPGTGHVRLRVYVDKGNACENEGNATRQVARTSSAQAMRTEPL
jgi:hypothetical protein